MNNQEAIKILKDTLYDEKTPTDYLEAVKMGREALENQKTGHWIPVSERLPKEFESVLVCYKSQGGMAQCVSERLVNMDGSNRWTAMYGQEPIAWMPLPEPYKAESEDKE